MNYSKQTKDLVDIEEPSCKYFSEVLLDFREVKNEYPFIFLTIPPTVKPEIATIHVIAANRDLIESCYALEEDFKGTYTKELIIEIPIDYKDKGCKVYGGTWIDIKRIPERQRHFNKDSGENKEYGYEFCVGVPASFKKMKNVILENIRTAEHLLIAYENYLCGKTKTIVIKEYSHGEKGISEYVKEQNKNKGKTKPKE